MKNLYVRLMRIQKIHKKICQGRIGQTGLMTDLGWIFELELRPFELGLTTKKNYIFLYKKTGIIREASLLQNVSETET